MSSNCNSPRFNSLTSEEYWDLRRVLDKRAKTPFSTGLSPEGQKAMEMAKADSEAEVLRHRERKVFINNKYTHVNGQEVRQSKKLEANGRTSSFYEAFERKSSARMRGDITDDSGSTDRSSDRRRALDGGNVNIAMETVEIVNFDLQRGAQEEEADDIAIEETAKLNSVEKCLVWMEVNGMKGTPT